MTAHRPESRSLFRIEDAEAGRWIRVGGYRDVYRDEPTAAERERDREAAAALASHWPGSYHPPPPAAATAAMMITTRTAVAASTATAAATTQVPPGPVEDVEGYDPGLFFDPVFPEMLCSICLNVFKDPVDTVPCGCTFCRGK